ncbi:cytochrome b5-like [Impatiens glandulifera]|uniref:cytochrome b5-like n=1 Tax=Impatiens glandulifera TaxID=253017 RepID=UPI001FB07CFE|nr:cytochrome b5-like [Impatiens glandulifera]
MASLLAFDDVIKHNKNKDCWVIISGKVYDVSEYMAEHPGGPEVLVSATGQDGTNDFEEAGHSDSAKKMMVKYCIGEIDTAGVPVIERSIPPQENFGPIKTTGDFLVKIFMFLVPLIIIGLALVYQKTNTK